MMDQYRAVMGRKLWEVVRKERAMRDLEKKERRENRLEAKEDATHHD